MTYSLHPIFVGGLMKSGTTLVRAMLSRHPDIFGGLETHWFTERFAREWRDPASSTSTRLLGFFDLGRADHEAVAVQADSAPRFLDAFMRHCATRAGKPRWVEKTPGNVLHLPTIFDRWPGARFIHVIRDPRDVYASWKRSNKYDLRRFIADAHDVERALGDRLGSREGAYLEVHYEDLVRQPRPVMAAMLDFVGAPWCEGIDDYPGSAGEFDKVQRLTGKASATLRSIERPIFQDGIGQWTAVLSPAEVAEIDSALASYCARAEARRG